MSKDTNRLITRRNVLAGIGATGIGTAVGTYGVAAGEDNSNGKGKNGYQLVPVAIDWQESYYDGAEWTDIDALPDTDDDGKQDSEVNYCEGENALIDVDDPLSSDLRTDNDYTDPGDPLINFHGLKPGYGGEVTLSYHLCDSSGKVKLKASDVNAHKKLLHEAQARVWYDEYDGSTVPNGSGEECVELEKVDDDNIDEISDGDADSVQNLEVGDTLEFLDGEIEIEITDLELKGEGSQDEELVGFEWESNVEICVVNIFGGGTTEVNEYDCETSGSAEAPTNPGGQQAGVSNFTFFYCKNGGNDVNGVKRGDNVYQDYEPIIAQGSLKKVLHKLENGVKISGDPYVASPFDEEGVNYYAYPRRRIDQASIRHDAYEPGWVTDDNIKDLVEKSKVDKIQDLRDGTKLHIPGVGYVAMDEESPLPELDVKITKVITDKKEKVVGFKWKSNLPICRIEVAGDETSKLNVYDRARSGTALAPLDDDNDDHSRRRPMTGFTFGVCDDHDEDDWCIENSNTGYIGFEWWLPEDTELKEKTELQANFDFKAKKVAPTASFEFSNDCRKVTVTTDYEDRWTAEVLLEDCNTKTRSKRGSPRDLNFARRIVKIRVKDEDDNVIGSAICPSADISFSNDCRDIDVAIENYSKPFTLRVEFEDGETATREKSIPSGTGTRSFTFDRPVAKARVEMCDINVATGKCGDHEK